MCTGHVARKPQTRVTTFCSAPYGACLAGLALDKLHATFPMCFVCITQLGLTRPKALPIEGMLGVFFWDQVNLPSTFSEEKAASKLSEGETVECIS